MTTIRPYYCTECGLRFFIPRKPQKERGEGHIKDLYCVRCGRDTKFEERNYITLEQATENEQGSNFNF